MIKIAAQLHVESVSRDILILENVTLWTSGNRIFVPPLRLGMCLECILAAPPASAFKGYFKGLGGMERPSALSV